uniref:MADS-box domain-containing protein n=1 Tax=Chenopodium quinoa TaxID=63459 RepID=A0A803M5D9_CHEQI
MSRKKVNLAFIQNASTRRATYKKRVQGLIKKTEELSVLCGVDACTIIYGPNEEGPIVWPSSEVEAKRIISEFKRKPEVYQSQRKFNQETFLSESIKKVEDKLLKLKKKNREIDVGKMVSDILNGKSTLKEINSSDLGDLLWVIEDKIKSIEYRIRVTKEGK